MVFSSLPFRNHVKKFGSIYNQDFSFLSKSNLKCLFVSDTMFDCSLMCVFKSVGYKDFTIITENAFF